MWLAHMVTILFVRITLKVVSKDDKKVQPLSSSFDAQHNHLRDFKLQLTRKKIPITAILNIPRRTIRVDDLRKPQLFHASSMHKVCPIFLCSVKPCASIIPRSVSQWHTAAHDSVRHSSANQCNCNNTSDDTYLAPTAILESQNDYR